MSTVSEVVSFGETQLQYRLGLYDNNSMTTRIVTKPIDSTSLTHKMHLTNWTIRIQPSYALWTDLIPREWSTVHVSECQAEALLAPLASFVAWRRSWGLRFLTEAPRWLRQTPSWPFERLFSSTSSTFTFY